MKMASAQIKRFLIGAMAAAVVALQPASSWAATAAELPWDRPLEALQQTLIGSVAPPACQGRARSQRRPRPATADELPPALNPA
jgi:hypothetical protein